MIKLSRLACYGTVIHAEMAMEDKLKTASGMSERTGLPEPTVAKILKQLARGGFIVSSRGIKGGYSLDRVPEEISIADIVAALEGEIALTGCVDGRNEACRLQGNCPLTGRWDAINDSVRNALARTSLSELIAQKTAG